MRRWALAALVAGVFSLLASAGPAWSSTGEASGPAARCKLVTKVVKGKKTRVRVCKRKKRKPKPPPPPQADLAVSLTPSLPRITAGNQLVYEAVLENLGPEPAENIAFEITFPAGSEAAPLGLFSFSSGGGAAPSVNCEGTAEQAETSAAFTFRCTIDRLEPTDRRRLEPSEAPTGLGEPSNPPLSFRFVAEPQAAGPFVVGARVTADTKDPHPANNVSAAEIVVAPGPASADLAVTVSGEPTPATVPDDLVETITVTNHGPTEATFVRVTVLLPLGVQLVEFDPGPLVTSDACPYSGGGGIDTLAFCWEVLQPGESARAVVRVAPLGAAPPTVETNVLTSAYTPDPALADNRATALVPVTPFQPVAGVDLVTYLGQPQTSFEGNYFYLRFGIGNRGAVDAAGGHFLVTVTGPVDRPSVIFFLNPREDEPIGFCEDADPQTRDCHIGSLPSGSRLTGYVSGSVLDAGPLQVTIKAIPPGADANPADNEATTGLLLPSPGPR